MLWGISNAYQVSYFLCPHVPSVLSEFLPSALLCLVAFTSSIPPPALLILTSTLVLTQTFPLTFFNPIMNFLLKKVEVKPFSCDWVFATPWTVLARLLHPWDFLGKSTGVGCHFLLQGIFPIQGSNVGLLHCRQAPYCLNCKGSSWGSSQPRDWTQVYPHCRQILYQLSYKGSPRTLAWIAYPFSSRSSWPRNWAGLFCIAGRVFTNWGIREALNFLLLL